MLAISWYQPVPGITSRGELEEQRLRGTSGYWYQPVLASDEVHFFWPLVPEIFGARALLEEGPNANGPNRLAQLGPFRYTLSHHSESGI
jgi:hypothetical protein